MQLGRCASEVANHKLRQPETKSPSVFCTVETKPGLVIVVVKNMATAVSTIKNASDERNGILQLKSQGNLENCLV